MFAFVLRVLTASQARNQGTVKSDLRFFFFFLNFGLFAVWLPRNCLKDFLASKQCADVVMFKRLLNNGVVLMFGSEKACSKIRESEVRGSASNRAMVNHELFATSILVIHMVLI